MRKMLTNRRFVLVLVVLAGAGIAAGLASPVLATLPRSSQVQGPVPPPGAAPPSAASSSLPPGEGRALTVEVCGGCHSPNEAANGRHTREEWTAIVAGMRARGVLASDAEAATIVQYLTTAFGPAPNTQQAPPRPVVFIIGSRAPDTPVPPGQVLESRPATGIGQKPAFAGQTRGVAVRTTTPLKIDVLTNALNHPWSLAFLPDGRMLVTEKPGAMRIVTAAGAVSAPIAGVPPVLYRGDSGLLDVVVDPAFATNRRIYWSYAEPRDGGLGQSVARARLSADDSRLEELTVILRVEPAYTSTSHLGSRLLFDRDGKLLVTTGERLEAAVRIQAQQLNSRLGKTLRINTDGTAAAGNPFANTPGALPEIWSYGNRNSQGLAFHPETGELWEIEHGQAGGDEVNVIQPGRNYGWPLIAYGSEYDHRPINGNRTTDPAMEQPVYYWDPSIGPTSLTFYSGKLIPEWRNNLFVASHIGEHLVRLVLDGKRVIGEERLLQEQHQPMRFVKEGPDGALWVLSDAADGRLIRISAASRATAVAALGLPPPVATFSILGFDPVTGEVGGAVESRVFSLTGVLAADADAGVVATQARVDVSYGPKGIALLKAGMKPEAVIKTIWESDPDPVPASWSKQGRQFAVIDLKGNTATFTGPKATAWAGGRQGKYCTAQGNILAGPAVVENMVKAFENTKGHLSMRLMAALDAGQAAGGDTRGMQAASMVIVKKGGGVWLNNDTVLRLQVDDNPDPLKALRRVVEKWNVARGNGEQQPVITR